MRSRSRPSEESRDWSGPEVMRPVCPIHGVREESRVVEEEGREMIQFSCPVEECQRQWMVRAPRS